MEEIKTHTQSGVTGPCSATFPHLPGLLPFGESPAYLLDGQERISWVDTNGKSSLNFQASMLLYTILAIPLCFIIIGIPIILILIVLRIVCIIVASIKASKGEVFKYPLSIPFVQ
jgi:uncharacterized Tic20 family protein